MYCALSRLQAKLALPAVLGFQPSSEQLQASLTGLYLSFLFPKVWSAAPQETDADRQWGWAEANQQAGIGVPR